MEAKRLPKIRHSQSLKRYTLSTRFQRRHPYAPHYNASYISTMHTFKRSFMKKLARKAIPKQFVLHTEWKTCVRRRKTPPMCTRDMNREIVYRENRKSGNWALRTFFSVRLNECSIFCGCIGICKTFHTHIHHHIQIAAALFPYNIPCIIRLCFRNNFLALNFSFT